MEHICSFAQNWAASAEATVFVFFMEAISQSINLKKKKESKPINDLFIGQFKFQILGEII